jgi:hypothetical protein
MQPHEILRAAADIVEADGGWCPGPIDAQDATGRAVPLYLGDARATINPTAAQFSAYGAICKALAVNRSGATRLMWETLQDIAQGSGFPNLAAFNNAEGRTAAEVATMLRTVADSLDPANRAIATVPSRATVPLSALAR